MWCLLQRPFFFVDSIIMASIYLATWQLFVSIQIEEQEEGAVFFNKMALHPTSVMRYKFPWTSDFLIGGLEETDQQHGPPETQTSHHLHFSVVICTKLSLHNRKYLRFKSPTIENSPSHSQNASTNMAKIENHIDVRWPKTSVHTGMFYGMYENFF